jgi:hypothetical protein
MLNSNPTSVTTTIVLELTDPAPIELPTGKFGGTGPKWMNSREGQQRWDAMSREERYTHITAYVVRPTAVVVTITDGDIDPARTYVQLINALLISGIDDRGRLYLLTWWPTELIDAVNAHPVVQRHLAAAAVTA